MALTDDQKAMLRLLAQREQGYDDIAALTGQSVDDVRAKVKEALAALEGGRPAGDQRAMLRLLAQREEGYDDIAALTGQGVDDVRAKVGAALAALEGGAEAKTPPPAPEPPKTAAEPEKPSPSKPPSQAPKPTPTPSKPKAPAASRLKLPEDRGAVWGLGAGLAVVLILVILLATGALGGSGESESGSGGESESSLTSSEGSQSGVKPTEAILKAVDGSEASGRALFGKAKKQVVLLLRAKGLEQAPKGQSYTLSLSKSATERLPLVATQVNKEGEVVGSFPVAPQVLGLLASGFDTMELSLVADGELSAALRAAKQSKAAPNYTGTDILRGPVTGAIVEAGEQGKVNP